MIAILYFLLAISALVNLAFFIWVFKGYIFRLFTHVTRKWQETKVEPVDEEFQANIAIMIVLSIILFGLIQEHAL